MAGGGDHHGALNEDPGLMKYNRMMVERYRYFRWTPRTAWLSFAYIVAFPSLIGYFAFTSDGKWDFRNKRRGDTIAEW